MAKGFGAIMATAAQAIVASKQKTTPTCPLCGELMEENSMGGAPWFCYGGRDAHRNWLEEHRQAAYEYHQRGGVVFYIDLSTPEQYRRENWNPDMQGVIMAVALVDGVKFEFMTVRGGNGVTNFRVEHDAGQTPVEKMPVADDWRWAEWCGV